MAVGQGISNLGQSDPRLDGTSRRLHPLLKAFIAGLGKQDAPPSRAYPVTVDILRQLPEVLDTSDRVFGTRESHLINLLVIGFFWLLRPCEYLDTRMQRGPLPSLPPQARQPGDQWPPLQRLERPFE